MIPELVTAVKYASLLGGGWIAKVLLTKWLGKTKEEAEIVLNWEEIHAARDKKLLGEIKRLEIKLDDSLLRQEKTEKNYRESMLRYENHNAMLRDDLVKCRMLNGKLQAKLDGKDQEN